MKSKDFFVKYLPVTNKILDVLHTHNVSPEEGETLLLYLAGMSAGLRQVPINTDSFLAPLAVGWTLSVKHGD